MKKTEEKFLLKMARGVLLDAGFALTLLALASALLVRGVIGQGSSGAAAVVCSALGVFLGSAVMQRRNQTQRLASTMAACGGYVLLLVLANLLFAGGVIAGGWGIVLPALLTAFFAAALGSRPKRTAHRKR